MAERTGSGPANDASALPSDVGVVAGARWLADHWTTLGLIVLPFGLILSTAFLSDEVVRLVGASEAWQDRLQTTALVSLVVVAVAHVLLGICQIKHDDRVSTLVQERDSAKSDAQLLLENARAVCDGFLQDLATPLGFGSQGTNSERITLYLHDSNRSFQPVGRFSFDQQWIKKGRTTYPDNQGCIGQAWKDGWHFCSLPNADTDLDGWRTACVAQGVPKTTADRLNMKSALYCACTLKNSASPRPVGVLVVESTNANRYIENDLKAVLTDDRRSYVARLLEAMKPWLGDLGDAKKEGF